MILGEYTQFQSGLQLQDAIEWFFSPSLAQKETTSIKGVPEEPSSKTDHGF
jgi:hypothetical protein